MGHPDEARVVCDFRRGATARCGRQALVTFQVGSRLAIHRCAIHASGFRRMLNDVLKNDSWTEQHVRACR